MPSTNSDFTPNNVWGSTAPTGTEEELTLTSGQTCRARKITLEGMLESGILSEADAITATVSKHIKKVKTGQGPGKPPKTTQEIDESSLLKDPKSVSSMMALMDRAMPAIVVSPVVKLHFTETTVGRTKVTKMIPVEDREEGVIYTDQISFEDKAELFNWAAGGLSTLLQFR